MSYLIERSEDFEPEAECKYSVPISEDSPSKNEPAVNETLVFVIFAVLVLYIIFFIAR